MVGGWGFCFYCKTHSKAESTQDWLEGFPRDPFSPQTGHPAIELALQLVLYYEGYRKVKSAARSVNNRLFS
jgi:hypothetical protein